MNDPDASVFSQLFSEAYQKCFGHPMTAAASETESRLFSNKIFDQTGLVIGPKSIKNYSTYVLNPAARQENPSVATLDTLARYVLNAPYTDETRRRDNESHYPYWFQYKNSFYRAQKPRHKKILWAVITMSAIAIVSFLIVFLFLAGTKKDQAFADSFQSVTEDSIAGKGWFIQSKNEEYWEKRAEQPHSLTLYTLPGDNWADSLHKPAIKNLLLRRISSDCFSTEIHLSEFVPEQNWQQAGILLLEDTNFARKSLRLSISYNDFYGGFPKSREIILQAIVSGGQNSSKPEEIAHQLVFKLDSVNGKLVRQNLQHSALRIEKNGTGFRLLFANGSMQNSAFKEILSRDIDISPHFVGLFALRGFVDSASAIPARFDFFSYTPQKCER